MKKPTLFGKPAGTANTDRDDGKTASRSFGRDAAPPAGAAKPSADFKTQAGRAAKPEPQQGVTMAELKTPAPNYPTYRGIGGGDPTGLRPGMPGGAPGMMGEDSEKEGSKLIVGRNIRLKGEIADCDTLVVEGHVEASMRSRIIEIAEGGVFVGKVEIDSAHVRGRFEGELTARERLTIHSTGKVSGNIRYGQIAIEAGGEISGDTAMVSKDAARRPAEPARGRTDGPGVHGKTDARDEKRPRLSRKWERMESRSIAPGESSRPRAKPW
jgi:cytoskeletal protein CcmA (bactofilin family)